MPDLSNFYGQDSGDDSGYAPANPASPTFDQITPLADKPFASEKVSLSQDEIAQIWRRVDSGLAFQKKVFWPTYRDALRLWEGKHWPDGKGNEHYDNTLVINRIPGIVRSLVESTAFQTPDFTLTPWNKLGEQNQQTAKAALRYWWREAHVQQQLKRVAWDSKMFGLGICQIGWLFRTETMRLDEGRLEVLPPGMPASGVALAQEHGLLNPGESAEDFVEADDVIEDRFQCARLSPMDVLLPPNATSVVDDWDWCARIERRPLAQVKGDPQFKNTRGLKGSTKLSEPYLADEVLAMDDERRPPDTRYVELITYYERDRRLVVTLCRENKQKPLRVVKWSWASRRYPFRVLVNTHLPDEIYGKSVPIELWDQQIELNECRTQNMLHRRQFNRMFQVPEGALDNKARQQLYAGDAGSIIEYANQGQANPVQEIPHPQLQPEVYRSYEWAEEGMEKLSGLSAYQNHNPPTKRLSATEAQQIQGAGGVLFMADAQAFTQLCEEVAEDLLDWTQQLASVTREIPIFDGEDVTGWTNFSGDKIRGDYLVQVNVNSTQPPDAQSQLQDNQLVLQTLVEAAQFTNPQTGQLPRPMAVVMRTILQSIGVRNVDELLPLPAAEPPMAPQPPALPPGPQGPAQGPGQGGPAALPPGPSPLGPAGPAPFGVAPSPPIRMNQATLQQVIDSLPPEILASILQSRG